jgi:hypothetical protein
VTAQKIISLVNNYQEIGNAEFVEISEFKKQYPWFSILHSLEAKCLKNENKFGLKKSIKTASLFAGDRERLYDFIHDDVQLEQPKLKVEAKVTVKVEAMPTKTIAPKVIAVEKKAKVNIAPTEVSKIKEQPQPVPIREVKPPVKKEIKIVQRAEVIYDPLVELLSKVKDGTKTNPAKPKKVYDPLVELPKLQTEPKGKKPNKQDFSSWLDSLENDKPKEDIKPRKLQMSAEASELLENFIKNRPSISRIRTDIDRTDVVKESSEKPGFELVTESLAQLHIKQGAPEKAVEIYNKLGLQNPQKFSYFAALIEKTKQEHNLE